MEEYNFAVKYGSDLQAKKKEIQDNLAASKTAALIDEKEREKSRAKAGIASTALAYRQYRNNLQRIAGKPFPRNIGAEIRKYSSPLFNEKIFDGIKLAGIAELIKTARYFSDFNYTISKGQIIDLIANAIDQYIEEFSYAPIYLRTATSTTVHKNFDQGLRTIPIEYHKSFMTYTKQSGFYNRIFKIFSGLTGVKKEVSIDLPVLEPLDITATDMGDQLSPHDKLHIVFVISKLFTTGYLEDIMIFDNEFFRYALERQEKLNLPPITYLKSKSYDKTFGVAFDDPIEIFDQIEHRYSKSVQAINSTVLEVTKEADLKDSIVPSDEPVATPEDLDTGNFPGSTITGYDTTVINPAIDEASSSGYDAKKAAQEAFNDSGDETEDSQGMGIGSSSKKSQGRQRRRNVYSSGVKRDSSINYTNPVLAALEQAKAMNTASIDNYYRRNGAFSETAKHLTSPQIRAGGALYKPKLIGAGLTASELRKLQILKGYENVGGNSSRVAAQIQQLENKSHK